jgi:hypothetical protein
LELNDINDIKSLLTLTINQVRRGEIDIKQANATRIFGRSTDEVARRNRTRKAYRRIGRRAIDAFGSAPTIGS